MTDKRQRSFGFHPGARDSDPDTSHAASAAKDHSKQQDAILDYVSEHGPGTEEWILTGIGVRQRSDASSEISALVAGGYLVNLTDPRTGKKIKLRNTSTRRALVRGLPAHQQDRNVIDRLLVQMDRENGKGPSLFTVHACKRVVAAVRKAPGRVKANSRSIRKIRKRR